MKRESSDKTNEEPDSGDAKQELHLGNDLKWEFDPKLDTKDDFKQIQVIGKGGFGTVCKIMHIPTQKVLAGKLVNSNLVDNPNTRKEIENEIKLMKEVDSEYTVHYFGSVQYNGAMMILMEYCDCGSLRDILDVREQVLTEDQISIVMRDLLKGLQLIHTRFRIVHRDIKAANILLMSTGEIKIADFGVSRRFEKSETIHTMTIVGTPYWMAPEVITGSRYSFSADLWSVGITAVELSEGAPSNVELPPTKAMIEIAKTGFPGYRFPQMHSPELMDFVSHCVVMPPDKRWTIEQLLEHPFIKRSENMPRLEILADLIQAGPRAAIQGNKMVNDSMMSFATGRGLTNRNLQHANQMPMGAGDTFNSMQMPFTSDGTTGSFDSFSTNGFSSKLGQGGAFLNTATNIDTFGAVGNFDTFGNSTFGNSAMNSFANNGFDSVGLDSQSNFSSFNMQGPSGLKPASNFNSFKASEGLNSGFDSFSTSGFNSGFDSFSGFDSNKAPNRSGLSPNNLHSGAYDSFNNAGFSSVSSESFDQYAAAINQNIQKQNQNKGHFMSPGGADLASATNFDSLSGFDSAAISQNQMHHKQFASPGPQNLDSFALPGMTGAGIDTFSQNLNKAKQQQLQQEIQKRKQEIARQQQQQQPQKNFMSPGGADLASSTNFDSFALSGSPGGFDSFAPGSNGFDSFAPGNNGFDSFALNSSNNFDTFSSPSGQLSPSNDQKSPQQAQKNFMSPGGADLASSRNFDSFALPGSPGGFDSFAAGNNGFDSFAAGNNGFDSFAPGNNGFDSFALNSSNNFDTFSQSMNNNSNKPEQAAEEKKGGNFVKPTNNFDTANFPSFEAFLSESHKNDNAKSPESNKGEEKPSQSDEAKEQELNARQQAQLQAQQQAQLQAQQQAQLQAQQQAQLKAQQEAHFRAQAMQQQQAMQPQSKPPLPPTGRHPPNEPLKPVPAQRPIPAQRPVPAQRPSPPQNVVPPQRPPMNQRNQQNIPIQPQNPQQTLSNNNQEQPRTISTNTLLIIGLLLVVLFVLGPEGFVAAGTLIIVIVIILSYGKRDRDIGGFAPHRD